MKGCIKLIYQENFLTFRPKKFDQFKIFSFLVCLVFDVLFSVLIVCCCWGGGGGVCFLGVVVVVLFPTSTFAVKVSFPRPNVLNLTAILITC